MGSFKQLPGCPDYIIETLQAKHLDKMSLGECYHPSDERYLIERIEVIKIRPQSFNDENIEKLIEGGEDPGTAILRLFNYSDYQIEGPKNKKKGSEKSSKMSDADMKQYFPELYKMQKDMEQQLNQQLSNPELERFEKEMKLLEKQIEESLK